MDFDKAFKECGLTDYFCDATKASVKLRSRETSECDRADIIQNVRLAALEVFDKRIKRLVATGVDERDAIRRVLTERHISSVVARLAKKQVHTFCKQPKIEELDDATATAEGERNPTLNISLREAVCVASPSLRQIYLTMADGYSVREIARKIGISEREVRRRIGELRDYLISKGLGL